MSVSKNEPVRRSVRVANANIIEECIRKTDIEIINAYPGPEGLFPQKAEIILFLNKYLLNLTVYAVISDTMIIMVAMIIISKNPVIFEPDTESIIKKANGYSGKSDAPEGDLEIKHK